MFICIFGTMMDNRMVGYIISRSENEEGESKGGHAPFGTRLCRAKCSVLYPLSASLRKVGDQDGSPVLKQTKRALFLCPCQS